MDIFIITLLIIGAVVLFLVELFFIPGISIAGILALGSLTYATYYAFVNIGVGAGFITLTISVTACVVSLILFMRSKTLDKVALTQNITSKVDKQAEESLQVGDTGIATTRLALIGQAEINGKIVEVRSVDGFLDEKTPIVVVRVTDGAVLVGKQN
jgi:Membrane-bound serine protease (ClpP class)